MLWISFRSGRNGRNFSYRYIIRNQNTLCSTSGQNPASSGPFWSFRCVSTISAETKDSASMCFGFASHFTIHRDQIKRGRRRSRRIKIRFTSDRRRRKIRLTQSHCFSFNFILVALSHHISLLLTFPLLENTYLLGMLSSSLCLCEEELRLTLRLFWCKITEIEEIRLTQSHCFSFSFILVALSHHTSLLLTFPLLENTYLLGLLSSSLCLCEEELRDRKSVV